MTKAKFEPVTIEVDGGRVKVRLDDEMIVVKWLCGGEYAFTADELAFSLENFAHATSFGADVWMKDRDHSHAPFHARLDENGFFYGSEKSRGGRSIPWASFEKALRDAIAAQT